MVKAGFAIGCQAPLWIAGDGSELPYRRGSAVGQSPGLSSSPVPPFCRCGWRVLRELAHCNEMRTHKDLGERKFKNSV